MTDHEGTGGMSGPYIDKHYQEALVLAGLLDQRDLSSAERERIIALAQLHASLSIARGLDAIADVIFGLRQDG